MTIAEMAEQIYIKHFPWLMAERQQFSVVDRSTFDAITAMDEVAEAAFLIAKRFDDAAKKREGIGT